MADATVIVRVDGRLKADFTEAAKAADRTTSQLLRDFMRAYVRQQANGGTAGRSAVRGTETGGGRH